MSSRHAKTMEALGRTRRRRTKSVSHERRSTLTLENTLNQTAPPVCSVPVVRHQEHHENGREKQHCGDTKDNSDDFVEIEGHKPAGSKDKPEKHEFVRKHEQETIFHFCLRARLHTFTERPNSSATVATRGADCNRDGPPPLDAAGLGRVVTFISFPSNRCALHGISSEGMVTGSQRS